MSDQARVRPATPADAPAIQRVARASWHAAYDDLIGPGRVDETVDGWYDPEQVVAQDVEPDERPLFVSEVDGRVVGFAEAAPDDAEPDTAQLYRIYVAPDHWGRGLGSALLDRVEAVAAERGFERLELSVLAANDRAVQFYEASGFERVGTTHDERFESDRHEYAKPLEADG